MKTIKTTTKEPVIMFITDTHGNNKANTALVATAHQLQPDLIVLGGDISNNTKASVRQIFKPFFTCNIPVVYYPGSHENSDVLESTLQELEEQYPKHKFINAIKSTSRLVRLGTYDLCILPGSQAVASGTKPYYGGNYWLFEKPNARQQRINNERIREVKFAKQVRSIFMSDTQKELTKHSIVKPTYRIGFCHDPPRFSKKTSIDVAHFGLSTETFTVSKKDFRSKAFKEIGINRAFTVDEGSVMALADAQLFADAGYPMKIMKRNVGVEQVAKFFKKNSIKKVFCGHIHEAGPRAITTNELKQKQKSPTKEIYANNGTGFSGRYTIITLHTNGSISHQFKTALESKK